MKNNGINALLRTAIATTIKELPDEDLAGLVRKYMSDELLVEFAMLAAGDEWRAPHAGGEKKKKKQKKQPPPPVRPRQKTPKAAAKPNGKPSGKSNGYVPRSALGKQVLEIVQQQHPITSGAVKEQAKGSTSAVSQQLSRLKKRGTIRLKGAGSSATWSPCS